MKKGFLAFLFMLLTVLPAMAAPNNTSGPWGIDVAGFKNLSTAVNSPATAGKTIVVTKVVIANSLTIPSDRAIEVKKGGMIIINSGQTLTINGPFSAGMYQVFSGEGLVTGLKYIEAFWFGVKDGGVIENTAAAQAAFKSAYYTAIQSGWRVQVPRIHFPIGDYLFTQPDVLFSGLYAGSFEITGEGKSYIGGRTNFIFTIPSYVAGQYFIKNSQIIGYSRFEGICFTATNGGNFMLIEGGGTGNAQNFRFSNCRWNGWTNIIEVTGTTMGSEVTFSDCSIKNFSGVGFTLNNPQAVNWRFYATDIEGFTGTLFQYIQGSSILFSQGSIIPYDPGSKVIDVPATAIANSFGAGNTPNILFHGTRFEMKSGAIMASKASAAANVNFVIKYDGCPMGGLNIPTSPIPNMFEWYGAGNVKFVDCKGMINYRFNWTGDGSTVTQYLKVFADNCDIATDFVTASTFTLTGATGNTKVYPIFNIRNCAEGLNGEYRPIGSNMSGLNQSKRFISFSATDNVAVGASGTSFTVTVPTVRLTEIGFYPTTTAAYGAASATITVKNADGSKTLATFTWTMNAPASPQLVQAVNYYVNTRAGDNLQVTFTSSYGGTVAFPGLLYLVY